MKTDLHLSGERGHAHHGWLDTYHSFSFAMYFNPLREQFGTLRVLNDDTIAGGSGFDTHPHANMEIITIPLEGAIEHRDSMGNHGVIKAGEVQVMSAGTGIRHSEFNHSKTEIGKFLQIWIFPRTKNQLPRYDQKKFPAALPGQFLTMVTPDSHQQDGALWIRQDAWISRLTLETGATAEYSLFRKENGLFVFVIEGSVNIAGHTLGKRDAIGIWETDRTELNALLTSDILLLEVPME